MSATTTVNSRPASAPSASSIPGLPATSRLLPRHSSEETDAEHPPIYLKLNSSVLALLADGDAAPKMSLEVSDKVKSLRIGNYEYQGSLYKEPGYLEVYLPEAPAGQNAGHASEARFRSCGQIRNRMTIKQDKPLRIASEPLQIDLAQPAEQRVLHLLALAPAQPQDLAAKAEVPRELVDAVLAQAAEPRGAESTYYVLKKELLAKLDNDAASEPSRGPQRQRQTHPASRADSDSATKPERVTKTLKDLREARDASSPTSSTGGSVNDSVSNGDQNMPVTTDEAPQARRSAEKKPSSAALSAMGAKDLSKIAVKRRAPAGAATAKQSKRARSETTEESRRPSAKSKDLSEEDLFEIARKFKNAYSEYLELYSLLSQRKARPASQVEKLLAMHHQLQRWKTTLWTNARSKRMVN